MISAQTSERLIFNPLGLQTSSTTTMDALQYAMNHIFLPPKLPQEQEPNPQACDLALCQLAYEAAVQFTQYYIRCMPPNALGYGNQDAREFARHHKLLRQGNSC